MSETESILNRIKNALQADGTLPEEFVLRPAQGEALKFIDGAMDGVIRYHMGATENPDISAFIVILEMASQERYQDAANALITHFAQGGMMLPVMDAVQTWAYEHPENLQPNNLGQFAMSLLSQSTDVESVKFALTVLEMLDREPTQELKELLMTLATSEELTLFCLFGLNIYPDVNELYFELAQKLRGWGKIHAVSMLKATTPEIDAWLLEEGWQNIIMPEYSACTVLKRIKLVDKLAQPENVSYPLFNLAGKLIGYSLEDSPIKGLASYKRTRELLANYLQLAPTMAQDIEDYTNIFDIQAFVEEHDLDNQQELLELCQQVLNAQSCRNKIQESMANGQGFYLAKSLGMDFASEAMDTLQQDWREHYDLVDILIGEKEYVPELLDFFEQVLPLEDMATGPEDEIGNSVEYADHGILSYVIQSLQAVPGKGSKLICAGLWSPVIGCRNIALNTLEKWRQEDFQFDANIQGVLAELKQQEVHGETKQRLEKF